METRRSLTVFLTLLVLAVLVAVMPLQAQDATASITGTIVDPSGAPVANATVVARDVDRGTANQAKTDSQGQYTMSQLPVGSYEIRVTQPGFQTECIRPSRWC